MGEQGDERRVQELMLEAFDVGMRAVDGLNRRSTSVEQRLKAAKSVGVALGRLDILELLHDPDEPGAVDVCNLSLRLRLEWDWALRTAAGPADRREARASAPGIRSAESGQGSRPGKAQRGVNE